MATTGNTRDIKNNISHYFTAIEISSSYLKNEAEAGTSSVSANYTNPNKGISLISEIRSFIFLCPKEKAKRLILSHLAFLCVTPVGLEPTTH